MHWGLLMNKGGLIMTLSGFILGGMLASAVVVHLHGKLLRRELIDVYSSAQRQQETQLFFIRNGNLGEAVRISERWIDHCQSAVSNLSYRK
jgi:hypothetical protein